jgi:uncharacterized membrane protein AbrB (regulator of aidB expression)
MPVPGDVKWAAGVIIVGLLLISPVLVWQFGWLLTGHLVFGLTIGLMVGMTKSSVVSGVLPLLFAFAGGSIVALSIGENRTPEQLETLGKQLGGFGIGTVIGLLVGAILSKIELQLPLGKFKE